MYIAFDINSRESWSRLKVEHPSHQEDSAISSDMLDLAYSSGKKKAVLDHIHSSVSFHHLEVEPETPVSAKLRAIGA